MSEQNEIRAFASACQLATKNVNIACALVSSCHPSYAGVSPEAQAGDRAASSPAAVPAASPGPLVAPALAPFAPAQAPAPLQQSAVNRKATVVDGMLQLQGQKLWPFDSGPRIALEAALAAAMPGIVADRIKILDTERACTSQPQSSSLSHSITYHILPDMLELLCAVDLPTR